VIVILSEALKSDCHPERAQRVEGPAVAFWEFLFDGTKRSEIEESALFVRNTQILRFAQDDRDNEKRR
jgi:hypothetical protein